MPLCVSASRQLSLQDTVQRALHQFVAPRRFHVPDHLLVQATLFGSSTPPRHASSAAPHVACFAGRISQRDWHAHHCKCTHPGVCSSTSSANSPGLARFDAWLNVSK
jgi:hypothetical protein